MSQPAFQLLPLLPAELAVGNMVRRILHMIRSESDQEVEEELEAVVQVTAGNASQGSAQAS